MSKVLVVATSRKTRGGITSVVLAHERGEQWKDFHCHWVQTHRDGPAWRKIIYMATSLIDYSFRLPFYDMVHIHFSNGNSLRRKLVFARLAKKLNKKILIHFHAFDVECTINGQLKEKYRDLFHMADGVIVLSNWWKDEVLKTFPEITDNIKVLYNPCQKVLFDSSIAKRKKILYAGTVNSRKGYADLIKAFSNISGKNPEWMLSIAGNGEIEKGKALATSLGIGDKVEFLGWVNGDAKQKAFQEASVFCLPSYAEGFPMAVLDAWSYHLPVITTPVGGIPDVGIDGENMLIFQPGDIAALSKDLEEIINNESLRNKIANASVAFADGLFSMETVNKSLADIYNDIASRI